MLLGCRTAAAEKEVAPGAGFIFERPQKSLTSSFLPQQKQNMDGGPPGIQSIAAPAAGCGLRGWLAQRCGLLSFPGDGSEAACALDPQSTRVWGGHPACGWVPGCCSVFGSCQTSQILCFPSAKTALGCLAGSRERQQNTELEPPNLELCCSRALRPDKTYTAGAEGGGPGLVSHRQGPVTPSGCPARTSRLAPDARVQKQGAPSTPLPRPASLRAACVTSHMEDGGWRACRGGRLEDAGWRAGRPCFESNACFVLH